jgi:hypothetical protein
LLHNHAGAFTRAWPARPAAATRAFPDSDDEAETDERDRGQEAGRPVAAAARLFEKNRPVQHWLTRYFKSLDQEEITVSVHPETGKVLGFGHTVPEDRPGADIAPERARETAAAFAAAQGWDVGAMELKESSAEKKKLRRDHTLVWEARAGDPRNLPRNLDGARYRVQVLVTGDRVSSLRAYWKIPEAWVRGRERQNALSILVLALRIVVMAGGMADGHAVAAAQALGCDLAYMGTKFIATRESLAKDSYKEMLVKSRLDDVLLTRAFTGLETNMLRPSIEAAGLDPDDLPVRGAIDIAKDINAAERDRPDSKRWKDIWSAGHSVSGVSDVPSVAELVERTAAEYAAARRSMQGV